MTGAEVDPDACPPWCAHDLRIRTGDGRGIVVIHHGPSAGVRVGDGRAGMRVTATCSTFYADHDAEGVPVLVDVEAIDQDDGHSEHGVSMLLDVDEVDQLVEALTAAREVSR